MKGKRNGKSDKCHNYCRISRSDNIYDRNDNHESYRDGFMTKIISRTKKKVREMKEYNDLDATDVAFFTYMISLFVYVIFMIVAAVYYS